MLFITSEMPVTLFAQNVMPFDLRLVEFFRNVLTCMGERKLLPPNILQRMCLTTSSMELDMYL